MSSTSLVVRLLALALISSFKKKSLPPKNQANPKHYTKADLDKNSELANPGESYEQALKRLNGRSKTPGTKEEQTKLNL